MMAVSSFGLRFPPSKRRTYDWPHPLRLPRFNWPGFTSKTMRPKLGDAEVLKSAVWEHAL